MKSPNQKVMLPTKFFLLSISIFIQFIEILSEDMASVPKPKILVFDLDYTLWPFWVDTHVNPPFRKTSNGSVLDSSGSKINHYPDVTQVLSDLHKQGYILAVASRTGEVEGARQLIELFGWKKLFSHHQIYPGEKTKHLTNIKNQFGVKFSEIIFFDDEGRNIRDVSNMGVLSILVRNGVTKQLVDDALNQFATRRSQ